MPNRIRELRKEKHLTQVHLGIELDVSQETISAYEQEKHYPSFVQLKRLSEMFGASIDYTMGLSDVRNPVVVDGDLSIQKIIFLCKGLTEKQRELVYTYVKGMTDIIALDKGGG